jgi:hypothetical protein
MQFEHVSNCKDELPPTEACKTFESLKADGKHGGGHNKDWWWHLKSSLLFMENDGMQHKPPSEKRTELCEARVKYFENGSSLKLM